MGTVYDDLLTAGQDSEEPIDPFWSIKSPNEDKRLEWLKKSQESLKPNTRELANQQLTNLAWYKGIHWESQDEYADFRDPDNARYDQDTTKLTINDPFRYVEHYNSKLTRFRPSILVTPHSNEFADKQGARTAKKCLDSHDQASDTEGLLRDVVRNAHIFGEQPVMTYWDEERGPISKRWLDAKVQYGEKKAKFNRANWTYRPDEPERLGEVARRTPLPWELYYGPATCPEECEWIQWVYPEHIEKIKADHPEYKSKLEAYKTDSTAAALDMETLSVRGLTNHVYVTEFYHRSNKYMRSGFYSKSIPGLELEHGDNPLSSAEILEESRWGDLPIERFDDLNLPGQFHGVSSLCLIKNLFHTRNKILTMMNRNLILAGHPKALVHRRAKVDYQQLTNDMTVLEWSGDVPPSIVTFSTFPPEIFQFYELLGGEMDKVMRVHPISSGTPPQGIKAGVALRLLEELEDLLITNKVKQHNAFIVAYARKRLAIMSQHYKASDNRLIQIIGRDNQDILETLDVSALGKRYSVKLEHAASGAQSPAAREQKVLDYLEVKPDGLTNEQAIDALELVQPEKITDPAQAAVAAAEYINELCSQAKELPEPREGEHHIVMWNIAMSFYQRQGFRSLPDKAQERFVDHMLAREFLMSEQALRSPAFAQRLFTVPGFPAFYHLPPEQRQPLQPGMDMAMGPGQPKPKPQMPQQLAAPDAGLVAQPPLTNDQIGGR